jgi:hypothetical protein
MVAEIRPASPDRVAKDRESGWCCALPARKGRFWCATLILREGAAKSAYF